MELIFATNNLHKLKEIRNLTNDSIIISGLSESGFKGEIPEDHPTLEQNASQKAWFIYNKLHRNCFADDTGLEVDALNGAPGVYSARFSRIGEPKYSNLEVTEGNILKLLDLMSDKTDRRARFRTVFALILDGKEYFFEGIAEGKIATAGSGISGFGYDPVFIPEGETRSFAEMDLEQKNSISHRGKAMRKLVGFLNEL
jgi:XTP/dITP diphosphohydrolase